MTPEEKREAHAAWKRRYRRMDPSYNRRAHLKKKFGITIEQHQELFASQGLLCAICGTDDPGAKQGWHTDHSHETGKVRGILCHHCNIAIGMARDNPSLLREMADYVERKAA